MTVKVVTEAIAIEIKTIDEAPNYNKLAEKYESIRIEKAIIVKKGMTSGRPSVDIQCQDSNGNKFLIFAKGGVIEMLGAAVKTVAEMSTED